MGYKLKATEVDAIEIPEGVTVTFQKLRDPGPATVLMPRDWLVNIDGSLFALSPDEFGARIELMAEERTSTLARKPRIGKPNVITENTAKSKPNVSQATIGALLLDALSEKARTVGELVAHYQERGRHLAKPSVSSTLNELKRRGQVKNNTVGEWSLK